MRANLGIVYKARTIDVCVDAVIERSGMTEPEAHDEVVRNAVNTGVT